MDKYDRPIFQYTLDDIDVYVLESGLVRISDKDCPDLYADFDIATNGGEVVNCLELVIEISKAKERRRLMELYQFN